MGISTKINLKRYNLIKAILKLLHPKAMSEKDFEIIKQSAIDYEADAKSTYSWFSIACATDTYKDIIEPPKNILDRAMSLETGKYVTYMKEGIEFKILKNLNDVTWEVV